jgi:hypothetical protein
MKGLEDEDDANIDDEFDSVLGHNCQDRAWAPLGSKTVS